MTVFSPPTQNAKAFSGPAAAIPTPGRLPRPDNLPLVPPKNPHPSEFVVAENTKLSSSEGSFKGIGTFGTCGRNVESREQIMMEGCPERSAPTLAVHRFVTTTVTSNNPKPITDKDARLLVDTVIVSGAALTVSSSL